jgi:hypothetical protein
MRGGRSGGEAQRGDEHAPHVSALL